MDAPCEWYTTPYKRHSTTYFKIAFTHEHRIKIDQTLTFSRQTTSRSWPRRKEVTKTISQPAREKTVLAPLIATQAAG